MEATITGEKLGVVLKVAFFVFLITLALFAFGFVFQIAGTLLAASLSIFVAATIANGVAMRVFERRPLADIGLHWSAASSKNLAVGLGAGILAACSVTLLPVAVRMAEWVPDPAQPGSFASSAFLTIILIFGAAGEEMMFRGYAFQILVRSMGVYATLIPLGVLFGLMHSANANASAIGIVNTAGFGVVLGYAFVRSGDLWLPIGIHFGWNWVLPVVGVNLSGFTMGVSGYTLRWHVSELWSGGAYGPEASLLTCGVLVGLVLFLRKAPVEAQRSVLLAEHSQEI